MAQPSEIPLFRGDLSAEDASSWLETLVTVTGSFSDSGIFRLLSTKILDGTSAGDWLDALEDDVKSSWLPFQRHFRARWIAEPLIQAREKAKWDEFCAHKLTYEMVFAQDTPDPGLSQEVVSSWVRRHISLAEGSNREAKELIDMTASLLPAFIQAYLHVYAIFASASFEDYCNEVEGMPVEIYQFEWHRQKKASKDIHSLEMQIKEVSKRVDCILAARDASSTTVDTHSVPHLQAHLRTTEESSDGSVAWEPCSPLTAAMSTDEPSEVITPKGEQSSLLDVAEDTGERSESQEDAPLPITRLWRKPTTSLSRVDRMAIADKCFDLVLAFESVISNNYASSANAAMAVYDKLTNRQCRNRDSRILLPVNRHPEVLWYSIEMIHRYRASKHSLTLYLCQEEWSRFVPRNGNVEDQALGFVCPRQPEVKGGCWDRYGQTASFRQQPSGDAIMAGGFFVIKSWPDDIEVWSSKTVLFMTLSSYLAECTNDPGILEWAVRSATCIKTHMLDSRTSLVKDCRINNKELAGSTISCHLTGIAIEGFSVLADVSGDHTWRTLAVDLAEAAMRSREWHGGDGILAVGSDNTPYINTDVKAFKGLLNRGLLVAYQRNPKDKQFRNLVRSYVNVQFNALLDLSSRQNSYGVDWRGPYVGPYPHGQLAALDTLIAAIGVND